MGPLQEGVGLEAINDSFLLEAAIYRLLRRHCREQPYYLHLLELFMEVSDPSLPRSQSKHIESHVCIMCTQYLYNLCSRHPSRRSWGKLWTS